MKPMLVALLNCSLTHWTLEYVLEMAGELGRVKPFPTMAIEGWETVVRLFLSLRSTGVHEALLRGTNGKERKKERKKEKKKETQRRVPRVLNRSSLLS